MTIGSAVCRVCLASGGEGDLKLLDINNQLVNVYELLTNSKMSEGENRLCYICLAQLQKCYRFAKMARRSEQYLNAVMQTDKEIKGETINNMLKLVKLQSISVNQSHQTSYSQPQNLKNTQNQNIGNFYENETQNNEVTLYQTKDTLGKETHITREITKINAENNDFEDDNVAEVKDCIIITKMFYECEICDKILESQQDLTTHKETHNKVQKDLNKTVKQDIVITKMYYECGGCCKILKSQEELSIHQNSHESLHYQSDTNKAISCNICRKYFNDNTQLYQHSKMHTGKRPFICDTCGKTFRTRCHLKAHISIHTMEKVYCKICNKGFSQSSSLGRHMLVHTGEFRFFCHICGRKCKQSGQLRMHIRTVHEGIKVHECGVCNKRFSVNAELQRHMACHSGVKAFECENCGVKVSTKNVLRRHKKNHCKKI